MENIIRFLIIYASALNLAGALLAISDKRRAIKGRRRISEKTLMLTSCFGGAVGMYLAMLTVRHKTKHKKFMIGLPLIIIAHIALLFILLISTDPSYQI